MAVEFELVRVADGTVLGTTADTGMSVTMAGQLRRTQYRAVGAGTTFSLPTAAYIDRLIVIPVSTGATTVTLSDGTTAVVSIPAAAHAVSAAPYSLTLGIANTSTVGFKLVCRASVAAIAVGAFAGAGTTA